MRRVVASSVVVLAVVGCRQLLGIDEGKVADDAGFVLPDAGPCQSISSECIGDVLRQCTTVGALAQDTPCSWGCMAVATPHCGQLEPYGGGVISDDLGSTAGLVNVTLPASIVLVNTDSGDIGAEAQPGSIRGAGVGIINGIDFQKRPNNVAVFRMQSLDVDGLVVVIGSAAAAFVSDGDIKLDGIIDARGLCVGRSPGPGGFTGGAAGANGGGSGAGIGGSVATAGGGGGGHGGIGGAGGGSANGINQFGDELVTILSGGGGGGGGGGMVGGVGGGGGGAIQLVTNNDVVIRATGGINAGGCGGKPGGNSNADGGGGAGGAILIEASSVVIDGVLAVNGGGGADLAAGESGRLDRMSAAGGSPTAGAGAAGASIDGQDASMSNNGGGGGIGRIRINTRDGTLGATGVLSPGLADPKTTTTAGRVRLR